MRMTFPGMPPDDLTDREASRFRDNDGLHTETPIQVMSRQIGPATGKSISGSTAIRNLIVLASGSTLLFVFAAISGFFSGIEEWERKNSLSIYHVEEFVVLLMVLGIATAIFLFRRSQEARGESGKETMPDKDISLVGTRPALRYEELENLFHRVETAKNEWQLSLDSIREMVVLSDLDGAIHRCNRAFKDFIGLPYEEILRENVASLLTGLGIDMKGLDLSALNARFHISGRWFGVRSYSYTDINNADINRVIIIMGNISARKLTEDKVQFVWGIRGSPCIMTARPTHDDLHPG